MSPLRVALLALGLAAGLPAVGLHAQARPEKHPRLIVRVQAQGQPLADAEVRAAGRQALSGPRGTAVLSLSAGPHQVLVWRIGYTTDTLRVTVPERGDTTVVAELRPMAIDLAPLVVRSLRSLVRVEDAPERVEIMAPEDVQEKTLTSPGQITNLLVEMGGVRVPTVAPGLGGTAVRVQGLPGRYTLLLSDGLPSYGAEPSSFALTQIPPVDLAQVEVIKGTATALYGTSALGGVVDLIPKSPERRSSAVLSGTTQRGADGVAWLSHKVSPRLGYTALAGIHRHAARDLSGDGWADLPGYTRAEARPRLFWTGRGGSTLMATVGVTAERRNGGTVGGGLTPAGLPFPESLDTRHGDVGAVGHFVLSPRTSVGFRSSAMSTRTDGTWGAQHDRRHRSNLLGEATLSETYPRHSLVVGAAAQVDRFRSDADPRFDFRYATGSVFASDTWTPRERVALSGGIRVDHHSRYGTFVSPRGSALLRLVAGWSLRASVGSGFSAPPPDGGLQEGMGLLGLAPAPAPGLRAERGTSASLDLEGAVGDVRLSTTIFGARVRDPVIPEPLAGDSLTVRPVNGSSALESAGLEAFAVYGHEPFLVTATFSHTRATRPSLEPGGPARTALPLTPRNRGGVDVAWEDDEPGESGLRVAVEVFYTGHQRVEEDPYREETPGFTTAELLVSKRVGPLQVFANVDDLTDVRQSHWDPLLLPTPGRGGRWTTDVWAPQAGRSVNLGVHLTF